MYPLISHQIANPEVGTGSQVSCTTRWSLYWPSTLCVSYQQRDRVHTQQSTTGIPPSRLRQDERTTSWSSLDALGTGHRQLYVLEPGRQCLYLDCVRHASIVNRRRATAWPGDVGRLYPPYPPSLLIYLHTNLLHPPSCLYLSVHPELVWEAMSHTHVTAQCTKIWGKKILLEEYGVRCGLMMRKKFKEYGQ